MTNHQDLCRLSHVALYVSDYERSIRFYQEALGMALVRQWGAQGNRTAFI
jgi:catechol 2,3-dioxygenase-like lactoylglutathione lyase family enzyme